MRVLIGSYGDAIAAYTLAKTLEPAGPRVWTPAPSFLAVHPGLPIVYAVSEVDAGAVVAFQLADDGITTLGGVPSGGRKPCHLTVTADGHYLVCANYGSGSVAAFALRADGSFQWRTDLVQHGGHGPHPVRQTGPHCHHVSVDGDLVHVVDLGTDHIVHYGLSDDGRLEPRGASPGPTGHGPRHLVSHPSGRHFVADELSSTLSTYDREFRFLGARPATTVAPSGDNFPSELLLSADGRLLYLANRGNNSITTYAVEPGAVRPIDEVPTGGHWPRHMAIAGETLLVANQRSDSVTALRLDSRTGLPRGGHVVAEIQAPACILVV
jgi:6-phosphogluconolactonase (cycloisomerase 2 family)